jgi:hypothetical protein
MSSLAASGQVSGSVDFHYLIAGHDKALIKGVEVSEDNTEEAVQDLKRVLEYEEKIVDWNVLFCWVACDWLFGWICFVWLVCLVVHAGLLACCL